jgi:hypothetical protein
LRAGWGALWTGRLMPIMFQPDGGVVTQVWPGRRRGERGGAALVPSNRRDWAGAIGGCQHTPLACEVGLMKLAAATCVQGRRTTPPTPPTPVLCSNAVPAKPTPELFELDKQHPYLPTDCQPYFQMCLVNHHFRVADRHAQLNCLRHVLKTQTQAW